VSAPADFIDFAEGISKGLLKAYTSDIDVFLLFTAGGLVGARSRRLRGIGTALMIYTAYRRGDQYVTAFITKAERIALLYANPHVAPASVAGNDQ
jgi:hypothetical protein